MWGEEEDDRRERERRARFGYNHAENGELLNAARRTVCTDRTCSVIPKNRTNKDNNKNLRAQLSNHKQNAKTRLSYR